MPEWERNQFVDETLTRAEREAPFRLGDGELEPIAGPTRLFLEIVNVFPALKDGDFPSGSQTFLADT